MAHIIPFRHRSRIAVLELHGIIGGRIKTPRFLPLIEVARRTRFLKGAVVDIDSPGGGATTSEYLHMALARLAQEKPLVAFISGAGASGAYLAACAAHRIVALPGAIVGSIGVLSLRPILEELLQQAGIEITVQKSGRLKDMGAFWRQPTQEEQEKSQALVDEFYNSFLDTVAQARKLEREQLKEYATGEVFTGRRAKELGLVDETGDLDRALEIAGEMAKVPARPYYIRPKATFRERLFGRFAQSLIQSTLEEVEERLSQRVYYR